MDKQEIKSFSTAQEAYTYLFIKLQEQGIDVETASERAFKFSSEYAERMGVPTSVAPKEKGLKGILTELKVVTDFLKDNPTIVEVGKPILTGLLATVAGGLTGKAIANATNDSSTPVEPITYEEYENVVIPTDESIQ
jgi:hypothetical protein